MRNYLKIIFFLIGLFISTGTVAQRDNDQRTLPTKIADLLAELPAKNDEHLKSVMNDIGALGEEGLVKMATMLVDPEVGGNSRLEYAIGGFSYYVTEPGRGELRQMSVNAYCRALKRLSNEQNKAFLIRQFEMVGRDDAVSCIRKYLNDVYLCAPATKALININTTSAQKALLDALSNTNGKCRLSLVQALGDTKSKEAVAAIEPLVNSKNSKLRKLALYALANIADPSSKSLLKKAAERGDFSYGEENGTSAYLLFARRLLEDKKEKLAEKIAKSLLKKKKDDPVHTRSAALQLITDIRGEKSLSILLDAVEDKNKEYRAAALKFAAEFINPETTADWVKKLRKSRAEVKAEIITMLGENNATGALPEVLQALKSENDQVRLAAIGAVGRIGGDGSLSELLQVMKGGNKEEIAAVRDALLIMNADDLTDDVADALPTMPADAQTALLAVLGNRSANERIQDVFSLVRNGEAAVRVAALSALEQMVTRDNVSDLFSLLAEISKPEEIDLLQIAIIAAIRDYENQGRQAHLVLEQMRNVSADKKLKYFPILASIGGQQGLNAVSVEFEKTAYPATKAAAINALSTWSDGRAAEALLKISRDDSNLEYKVDALSGYIGMVTKAEIPAEQKLLMLRKAFDGSGIQHKKLILEEVGELDTFPALIFAGKFLDEPLLSQEAAHAVRKIALDNEFYGSVVRELLNKTKEVLEGPESEYQKQEIKKFLSEMPLGKGIVTLFDGDGLSKWKGVVANPIEREKMDEETLRQKQQIADEEMRKSWKVENGELIFTGKGKNIATQQKYGDFEMFLDWKIFDDGHKKGDGGIYLRGTPQVQLWDTSRVDVGAQVGSGGLYNNQKNQNKPIKVADNPLGEWNTFHIIMKGDRVTVYLNGELVTDNTILENYWDRNLPIFPEEQIELQSHKSRVAYRDIYIREIPRDEPFKLSVAEKEEGFKILLNGTNMYHWMGNTTDYILEDGKMVVREAEFGSGNLFTKEVYSDFIIRFEFKLTPGANNGLGIRAPLEGDIAYEGMEIQILDNYAEIYKNLENYQYHGSVYGVIPARRGFLKPVGQWNSQEVIVDGPKIKVILNGTTILDGNISEAAEKGTLDGKDHPGIKRNKGHIGFLGHGSEVHFRNIRIKRIK